MTSTSSSQELSAIAIYDRFLIIGSGGREHAIISALHGTRDLSNSNQLYLSCVGTHRNPGITTLCNDYKVVKTLTERSDIHDIVKHALINGIEVAVIGPEAPLQAGIVNQFARAGIPCIGPGLQMAEIETDKAYARHLFEQNPHLRAHNPQYFHYRNKDVPFDRSQLNDLIADLNLSISLNSSSINPSDNQNYVIKAVGLKGGKGVKVGGEHLLSFEDTFEYCQELIKIDGQFIIEEKLVGDEFSLISLSDGRDLVHLPIVQDYKRAFEGDQGPNTGGMGSILLPTGHLPSFLTPSDVKRAQEINQLVLREVTDGYQDDYTGVLYGSFIKCHNSGQLKIIEYNARFGDPEVINLMHCLQTDLSMVFSAMINEQLADLPPLVFSNQNEYVLCRYLCPSGYPTEPLRGSILTIDSDVPPNSLIYASLETTEQAGECSMLGSRALAIVTQDADLSNAINQSDNIITQYLKGRFHYRTDIGHQYLPSSISPFDGSQVSTPTSSPECPSSPAPEERSNGMTYQDAGVNIDEANQVVTGIRELVKSTHNQSVVTGQYGNFGGSFNLNPFSPTLVTSMDGVGTKVQTVLNLLPRAEAFESLGRDLFSSNVNDILCLGQEVRPLFFLDYFGCQKLDHHDVQAFVKGLAEACRTSNCVLIGGETAELPDFTQAWENYHQNTIETGGSPAAEESPHNNYELVGTVVGSMYESVRFDPDNLKAGQRVLALKSSGPHTNGYSLINRLITMGKLDANQYRQELCQSHRNYYPDLVRINQANLPIQALCHITGGGLIENPPRILPDHLEIEWKEGSWTMPPVFQAIQAAGHLTEHEMYRTFNCGLGMLIIVDQNIHPHLIDLFGPDDLFYVGNVVDKD